MQLMEEQQKELHRQGKGDKIPHSHSHHMFSPYSRGPSGAA